MNVIFKTGTEKLWAIAGIFYVVLCHLLVSLCSMLNSSGNQFVPLSISALTICFTVLICVILHNRNFRRNIIVMDPSTN
ncbi:hypothetical protein GJ496_002843 [Pomphorhynchus laevis]|nr:hypothetical protein GJ496_002843 [Pomphorhynchus laevis]